MEVRYVSSGLVFASITAVTTGSFSLKTTVQHCGPYFLFIVLMVMPSLLSSTVTL